MNPRKWIPRILLSLLTVIPLTAATFGPNTLNLVRLFTVRYHSLRAAQAAGYELLLGLDHCFENPGTGGMGYHYIRASALDTQVDPLKPEAMVYAPQRGGRLTLAAVEYVVPIEAWDEIGSSQPPSLFGQQFHRNETLGVYALHAWIWKYNPDGVFADWNPLVSCPSGS